MVVHFRKRFSTEAIKQINVAIYDQAQPPEKEPPVGGNRQSPSDGKKQGHDDHGRDGSTGGYQISNRPTTSQRWLLGFRKNHLEAVGVQRQERPQDSIQKKKSVYRGENTLRHPRHPPIKLKTEVLHRCFELGEDVKSVSEEIGYSRASIYTWRRKYLREGMTVLMNSADAPRGELIPGTVPSQRGSVG